LPNLVLDENLLVHIKPDSSCFSALLPMIHIAKCVRFQLQNMNVRISAFRRQNKLLFKLLSHILSTTLLSGIEIGNFTFLKIRLQEK